MDILLFYAHLLRLILSSVYLHSCITWINFCWPLLFSSPSSFCIIRVCRSSSAFHRTRRRKRNILSLSLSLYTHTQPLTQSLNRVLIRSFSSTLGLEEASGVSTVEIESCLKWRPQFFGSAQESWDITNKLHNFIRLKLYQNHHVHHIHRPQRHHQL